MIRSLAMIGASFIMISISTLLEKMLALESTKYLWFISGVICGCIMMFFKKTKEERYEEFRICNSEL